LRHYDDHPVTASYTVIAQHSGLKASSAAKLGKGDGHTFVFIDPSGYKRTVRGSRVECLDQIVKLVHAVVTGIRSTQ